MTFVTVQKPPCFRPSLSVVNLSLFLCFVLSVSRSLSPFLHLSLCQSASKQSVNQSVICLSVCPSLSVSSRFSRFAVPHPPSPFRQLLRYQPQSPNLSLSSPLSLVNFFLAASVSSSPPFIPTASFSFRALRYNLPQPKHRSSLPLPSLN